MSEFKGRLVEVRVVPKAGAEGVECIGEDQYKVRVTVAPEKGKANARVLQLLAKELNCAPSNLKVVRGESSRTKWVRVLLMLIVAGWSLGLVSSPGVKAQTASEVSVQCVAEPTSITVGDEITVRV
ncbi:MAG: DUF167 domain-containing protein, partial [Candidatus Omnitrophica bacterium]|nr:DUF167 domain-containing protein [Candidatus Omnitrophota bacterium]